jgi:hypothetical protein
MIQVSMRKEYFIDPVNASTPKKRRNLPAGHFGPGYRAGVVEQGSPVRRLQYRTAAMPDGKKGAAQFIRGQAGRSGQQAKAYPAQACQPTPAPALP